LRRYIAGWANFAFTANVTRIIEGARLGLTHLLKVNELFWERTNGAAAPLLHSSASHLTPEPISSLELHETTQRDPQRVLT